MRGRCCRAVAVLVALGLQAQQTVVVAQSLPKIPGFPSIPSLPSIPGIPGLTAPKPPGEAGSSAGGLAAVLGVCTLLGVGGAALGKRLAASDAKRLNLTPDQRKQREQSYMLGGGLFGCSVGGSVAASVINNMSAAAKKAQDDAWQQAQQQTGPVAWSAPDAKGTSEIVERQPLPDGGECGTRRDVIEATEGGRAEPMIRVCRVVGSPEWKPVSTVA